jgi:hypothetical protein
MIGLVLGAAVGCSRGWFRVGRYEAIDSAIGTASLCALLGAITYGVAKYRDPKRH